MPIYLEFIPLSWGATRPKNRCCENIGDRCASYSALAKLSHLIMKVFHVYAKKSCRMAATIVSSFLAIMRGVHVRLGFRKRKLSTMEALHMNLGSETIGTGSRHVMTFSSRSTGQGISISFRCQTDPICGF